MRAAVTLSSWMIALHFQLLAVHAHQIDSLDVGTPISFNSSFGTPTEQYIPEDKRCSIAQSPSDSNKALVLIYPFFQDISLVKNEDGYPSLLRKDVHTMIDGLFHCQIFLSTATQQRIHPFTANKGQDVYWLAWIPKSDAASFLKDLTLECSPAIYRELLINKSLSHMDTQGSSAVETGVVLERKPGRISFSTTTDMRAGDCHAIIIPHQPFNPDSMKTISWLYAKEGIKTKIYTDDMHLLWQKVDTGKSAFYMAKVQHPQQFGAHLSFEIYAMEKDSTPDISMVIVKKGAVRQARAGYDAKGLYQAEEWHRHIESLQKQFKERQIAEQLKKKEEVSTILAGRTFRLFVHQNGQLKEISSQPGSMIYQVSERFLLIMNPALEYALLDMENSGLELEFSYSKAEYFPSMHLLALYGKQHHESLVIQTEGGEKTQGNFTNILVRNAHLYASTTDETLIFSDKGFLKRIPLVDKVLFESPDGNYYAAKHKGRGEVFTADKQQITNSSFFFTQLGSVNNQGIILGRANLAMAAALDDPSLVHAMHFYRFNDGRPKLIARAGCVDVQHLGEDQLACKSNENSWHLFSMSGNQLESRSYNSLDNLLTSLQIPYSDLTWNKELRPATLKTKSLSSPEDAELRPFHNPSEKIIGVFGPAENRIWVIQ